jgi:hypothetical protein
LPIKETAIPSAPKRPVRPTRWMYVSGALLWWCENEDVRTSLPPSLPPFLPPFHPFKSEWRYDSGALLWWCCFCVKNHG